MPSEIQKIAPDNKGQVPPKTYAGAAKKGKKKGGRFTQHLGGPKKSHTARKKRKKKETTKNQKKKKKKKKKKRKAHTHTQRDRPTSRTFLNSYRSSLD